MTIDKTNFPGFELQQDWCWPQEREMKSEPLHQRPGLREKTGLAWNISYVAGSHSRIFDLGKCISDIVVVVHRI
jgi:hypothetical protein